MSYLELIAAIAAAEREQGIDELDAVSRHILQSIATANQAGVRMRMKDLSTLATFPTLHAHVQKLVDTGWIERTADETDHRAILLRVTPMATEVFRRLSDMLDGPPVRIGHESCPACVSRIRSLAFSEFDRKYREFASQFIKAHDPA